MSPDLKSRSELAAAVRFFEKHRVAIQKQFKGQFVAILDGAIIEHGPDYRQLEAKCVTLLPERYPYIAYAGAAPLLQLFHRFTIRQPIDETSDREAWEGEAARDAISTSHE